MSFEILGVVDLRHGLAVRARGGRRDRYMPIESVAGESIPPGDVTALTRQYIDRFGLSALYLADLDAIEHRTPQRSVIRHIASTRVPLWLDAGLASVDDARHALECGASRLIVGLETLPSFQVLESIVKDAGHHRVVFSLDLRDGRPVAAAPDLTEQSPEDLVARAADAGVAAVVVLDLARVGAGSGFDLALLSRLRGTRSVPLYAGGGVRRMDDLLHAREAGCAGALIASALLDGDVTEQDLRVHLCPLT